MQYEILFWSMLAIVAGAMLGGVIAGFSKTVKGALVWCLMLAAVAALCANSLLHYANISDGTFVISVATFMFAWVISSAASLFTQRVRTLRSGQRLPSQ